jgi:hypothetical protein
MDMSKINLFHYLNRIRAMLHGVQDEVLKGTEKQVPSQGFCKQNKNTKNSCVALKYSRIFFFPGVILDYISYQKRGTNTVRLYSDHLGLLFLIVRNKYYETEIR